MNDLEEYSEIRDYISHKLVPLYDENHELIGFLNVERGNKNGEGKNTTSRGSGRDN